MVTVFAEFKSDARIIRASPILETRASPCQARLSGGFSELPAPHRAVSVNPSHYASRMKRHDSRLSLDLWLLVTYFTGITLECSAFESSCSLQVIRGIKSCCTITPRRRRDVGIHLAAYQAYPKVSPLTSSICGIRK